VPKRSDLRIVHIGAGRYRPGDREHVTYGIWRELACGFGHYHAIGRSESRPAEWTDGNLTVTLVRSFTKRELEFFATQFCLVRKIAAERPDAIICQSPVLGGFAAIVTAHLTGARVLSEFHGAEFFTDAPLGSRDWLLQRLAYFVLKRSAVIRVLSPRMRQRLGITYGPDQLHKAKVLPPRVNLARFCAQRGKRRSGHALRLAMVGSVNSNKGQMRLIRALEKIPFRADLHIVGSGPDLEAVRDQSRRLSSERSNLTVTLHGTLDHASVVSVLQKCDALVMYSLSEGTPRAMMEAMSVGLPVISTDVGFCADLFEHGREGFLLGDEPDKEVVGVLRLLHEDRARSRSMGNAARSRARRDFDSVKLFEAYRQLIEETASR